MTMLLEEVVAVLLGQTGNHRRCMAGMYRFQLLDLMSIALLGRHVDA